MWFFLLAHSALFAHAGDIVIDAEIPVEVAIDGRPIAQVLSAASIRFTAAPGDHKVTLMLNGNPSMVDVTVTDTSATHVVVGKSGITQRDADKVTAADVAKVELRIVGRDGLFIVIDGTRYKMSSGDHKELELTRGTHEMDLRSYNGTVVYSSGKLDVRGTGDVVLHLSAGRQPEVTGTHARWLSEER